MTDIAISALPAAAAIADTDLVPVVEIGTPNVTKRGTAAQMRAPLLPLTGGTLIGPLITSSKLTFTHSTVTDLVAPATGYQIQQDITYDLAAGSSGIYFGNEMNFVVTGNPTGGTAQVWNNLDRGFLETANTATMDMVVRFIQGVRPAGFPAPASVMQGVVIDMVDQTGSASSVGGGMNGLEIDLECNGLDDGSQSRQALLISLNTPPGIAGAAPSAAKAIGIFAGAGYFRSTIQVAAAFYDSILDTRVAGLQAGGAHNAIWLGDGQKIAFDTAGNFTVSTDGTYFNFGRMINAQAGVAFNGVAQLVAGDGNTIGCSEPFRVPGYTVAALPALAAPEYGSLAFATNARNSGEAGGAGSGCLVYLNTSGTWLAAWSGLPPTI